MLNDMKEKKPARLEIFRKRFFALSRDYPSITEFADKIGISRQTCSYYLSGNRLPDAVTLLQICDQCEVSADYLLGITDVRSRDLDIQNVCRALDLSEPAVMQLVFLREGLDHPATPATLEKVLLSGYFSSLVESLADIEKALEDANSLLANDCDKGNLDQDNFNVQYSQKHVNYALLDAVEQYRLALYAAFPLETTKHRLADREYTLMKLRYGEEAEHGND